MANDDFFYCKKKHDIYYHYPLESPIPDFVRPGMLVRLVIAQGKNLYTLVSDQSVSTPFRKPRTALVLTRETSTMSVLIGEDIYWYNSRATVFQPDILPLSEDSEDQEEIEPFQDPL